MASKSPTGQQERREPAHKVPDWEMAVETELVRRNLDECMRGEHEPWPMVPAIHPSSTFLMQDSKEGEILSGNKAKVGVVNGVPSVVV